MNKQELTVRLIGEQIRNQVLVQAFENIGFDCTMYTLNVSEIILTLTGFNEKADILYQRYFELIEAALKETSYRNMDEMMSKWSSIIFNELQDIKLKGFSP